LLPPLTPDASSSCSGVSVAQSTSRTYTPPMPKLFSNGVVDIVVRVAALAFVVVEPQRARKLVAQVVHGVSYVQ
jgi:hypothetical protein